ncbi:MAG: CHASE2 domain-containing protein [Deltaproteobacteria bacterium]|nr:CHASE2 domain-containing protein [Deltaproteobacteria bacterium]
MNLNVDGRLLSVLARASAGDALLFVPISVLLALALARIPALQYLGAPLDDTAARAVVVGAPPAAWLIDLGEWSNDPGNVAVRGDARQRLADLVTLLAKNDGVVVGVDVLLESSTRPDADEALARALVASKNVVIARSERPLRAEFQAVPSASVIIPVDAGGVTRRYTRGVDESLAGALLARTHVDVDVPARSPLIVSTARPPRLVTSARAVLDAGAGFLAALPAGTALFVGLTGEAARAMGDTRTVLQGPEGYDVVAGIELHARAYDDVKAGVAVVDAGPWLTLLLCLPFALTAALVARRTQKNRGSAAVVVAVVVVVAALGLPLSVILGSGLRVFVSPFVLALAPIVAVIGPGVCARGLRVARFHLHFRARIAGAPPSLRKAMAGALLEPGSAARMARLLSIYEDLAHYVIVCRLALDGDKKHNGAIREGWHIQHTLATTLAVLRALVPSLAAAVQEASEIGDDQALAARVRKAVPTLVLVDDDVKELAEVSTREKHRNWFMVLRNAVAHEGTAGFPDDVAALLATVLERQLARIVALPEMSAVLERSRFVVVDGDPILQVSGHADPRGAVSLAPWLRVRHGVLFRYRGLADRRDFPKVDGRLRRLVVFRAVDGGTALPEALLLPLGEILPLIPAALRIEETEGP